MRGWAAAIQFMKLKILKIKINILAGAFWRKTVNMPDIPRMPDNAYTDTRHTDIVTNIPDMSYQT